MSKAGFRILPFPPQPSREALAALKNVATAHLSDNMSRLNASGAVLRAMHKPSHMVGTALTVKVSPGDNLMVHKAIDIARPGDVIVVDAGGDTNHAIIGEIMSSLAESRGAVGMVIDGSIRDAGYIAASTFPIYARGVTHRGPFKNGPGEINIPIAIAGMVVNPGDIIVGDEDGLVVVAPAQAIELAKIAKAYADGEAVTLKKIRSGDKLDRSWVDETLRQKGCEF
jgi:RraA family protein